MEVMTAKTVEDIKREWIVQRIVAANPNAIIPDDVTYAEIDVDFEWDPYGNQVHSVEVSIGGIDKDGVHVFHTTQIGMDVDQMFTEIIQISTGGAR